MFIQNAQLNDEQLTQLDQLCAECKHTDKNIVATYRHLLSKNRNRPANILYYEYNSAGVRKLAGFLAAFFFSEEVCEITLMITPTMRRQSVAIGMLKAILPLIKADGIQQLTFSSPHGLNDLWFTTLGLQYQGSEFEMLRTDNKPVIVPTISASIRVATDMDISTLCAIDKACFPSSQIDQPTRIHRLLNDPAYCLFVITQDNKIVGKAHLNWLQKTVRLSDIAILPDYQRHGLGTALLAHCINYALAMNQFNIVLDVETKNKHALRLYTHLGFSIINAHDYWSIDEFALTAFLQHL